MFRTQANLSFDKFGLTYEILHSIGGFILERKTVSFILFSNIDNLTREKPSDGVDVGRWCRHGKQAALQNDRVVTRRGPDGGGATV